MNKNPYEELAQLKKEMEEQHFLRSDLTKQLIVPNVTNHLQKVEGFEPKAYADKKNWAIGYGRQLTPLTSPSPTITVKKPGELVFLKNRVEQELTALRDELGPRVFNSLTPSQIVGLSSTRFNIGPENFNKSTAKEQILKRNPDRAAQSILWWNDEPPLLVPGMNRRRRIDSALIRTKNYKYEPEFDKKYGPRRLFGTLEERMAAQKERELKYGKKKGK